MTSTDIGTSVYTRNYGLWTTCKS